MKRALYPVITNNLIMIVVLLTSISAGGQDYDPRATDQKLTTTLQVIRFAYVDTINEESLVEFTIKEILKKLDPHSAYISKEELAEINEPLEGNFEGIGISFQVYRDTILVISVSAGGPSEKVGLLAGDKIIRIDNENVTGSFINPNEVQKRLKGPKSTKVKVGIRRKNHKEILYFTIERDKIPLHSIDASFMAAPEIGFVKVNRFSRTTVEEFHDALKILKKQGMKHLILDLRGNTGGYLNTAIDLADEFLDKKELIVYTEGISSPTKNFYSSSSGIFKDGRLIVLIDEGSASASEILAGAIQDLDRGLILGRRSFGKGLVQRPFPLPDGSLIRLTTARYHTPSGRCIQRPYGNGYNDYYGELFRRFENGEFLNPDSINFPDSLKFLTSKKRVVYGGGGIMPDIFSPLDTSSIANVYSIMRRKGHFNTFTLFYLENNRDNILNKYPDLPTFKQQFPADENLLNEFLAFSIDKGLYKKEEEPDIYQSFLDYTENIDTLKSFTDMYSFMGYLSKNTEFENGFRDYLKTAYEFDKLDEHTNQIIKLQLKGLIARNLFDISAYYEIIAPLDMTYIKAVEIIQDEDVFKDERVDR